VHPRCGQKDFSGAERVGIKVIGLKGLLTFVGGMG
jgi:hypothetical protein